MTRKERSQKDEGARHRRRRRQEKGAAEEALATAPAGEGRGGELAEIEPQV